MLRNDALRAELPGLIVPLRAHARALCRDASLADDLVQETLLSALRAETQFTAGTSARAWLFTILRHAWMATLRRRRREAGVESEALTQAPDQPGRMALMGLGDAMARLPPTQREALLLVAGQGMSLVEAAQICGVPVGTIKARVSRGRSALRLMLAEAPDSGPA